MSFYHHLVRETTAGRDHLMRAPILEHCLAGNIGRSDYLAFLAQAYHHVRHTVPLLQAVLDRLPGDRPWLIDAVTEYIADETGHEQWVLNDIEVTGGDPALVRRTPPDATTELMVAYAYDMVQRVNPLGFFGMVQVLEGTSVALAERVARAIQKALLLPDAAFSYLRSHGALDQEHIARFAALMDRISDPQEQALIRHAARMFYRLYGDLLHGIDGQAGRQLLVRTV